MTTREKRLAGLVVGVAGLAVAYQFIWPRLKAMVDLGGEIAQLEQELNEHLEERDRVDDALLKYKEYVSRTGGRDALEIKNNVHRRLEELAVAAELPTPKFTPKSPSIDRKTGLSTVSVGISAEGTLQAVLEFLKECYELPYVATFKDIKLAPAGAAHDNGKVERVTLQSTLDVKVLPDHKLADGLIDSELQQPETMVKHQADSYAMIWNRDPFSEYQKPVKPPPPRQPERPVIEVEREPVVSAPPTPKGPTSDPQARDKKLVLASKVVGEKLGVGEVLVVNTKQNTREYVAKGERLDEGELLYVHPYGAIVRKDDGDYFYEVGHMLSEPTNLNDVRNFPEIERLAALLPPRQEPANEPEKAVPAEGEEDGNGESVSRNSRPGPPTPNPPEPTSRPAVPRRTVPGRTSATTQPVSPAESRKASILKRRAGRRPGRISLTPNANQPNEAQGQKIDEPQSYPAGTTREEATSQPTRGVNPRNEPVEEN